MDAAAADRAALQDGQCVAAETSRLLPCDAATLGMIYLAQAALHEIAQELGDLLF